MNSLLSTIETVLCPVCGGVCTLCDPYSDEQENCWKCGGQGEMDACDLAEGGAD